VCRFLPFRVNREIGQDPWPSASTEQRATVLKGVEERKARKAMLRHPDDEAKATAAGNDFNDLNASRFNETARKLNLPLP
jgi:hypothetical protein